MNIEIKACYTVKNPLGKIIGWSLHVYLEDIKIHIRGIFIKKKEKPFMMMPQMNGRCPIKGVKIRFCVLMFEDKDFHQEFINNLKEKCLAYIQQNKHQEIVFEKPKNKFIKHKVK